MIQTFRFILILLTTITICSINSTKVSADGWPIEINVQHQPGAYWWTPGSAWDKESIDWNLENFKQGGIGTLHVIPIYGAKGYEDQYIPFLSDEWMDSFQYILEKANELGLQIDMTTGTGWCFGGPNLDDSLYDQIAKLDKDSDKLQISSRRMVKRAAPGGEGKMLNPFSVNAMNAYLERFTEAFDGAKRFPRAQYHDSFEYTANWCVEMPEEFSKRRGYDLNDHIKTLFGENINDDNARRIKYDYRLTAAELHREYIQTWSDWSHERGMLTRNQAHGSPANLLDVYATADIPETEMFGSPEFPIPGFRHEEMFCRPGDSDPRICRMASSAAHVAHEPGKQLVTSESCTWMREHWHGTLGQIKLEMDLFFLTGVNQVLYHGSCYSAKDAPWPGWFFYASTKADWRNSIWRDMPALNNYIARCQSILQAGQPANDILVYWPIHDLWMNQDALIKNLTVHTNDWMEKESIGKVANLLDSKGYAFDFVSDRMLQDIQFNKGYLSAPGGQYKTILIPKCEYMPAETLSHLADLSSAGAKIIFEDNLPADVPGYGNLDQCRNNFKMAKARMNKAIVTSDISEGWSQAGIERETLVDEGLRYIRRKTDDSYWYFIANHTGSDISDWFHLAIDPYQTPVMHDPMTGSSKILPIKVEGKSQQIYIEIKAGETLFIQASKNDLSGERFVPLKTDGEEYVLNGQWNIEFIDGSPDMPKSYQTDSLSSWTNAPDKKAQAFAGTARYTLTFDLPDIGDGDDVLLKLGDVRESAKVTINGKQAGTLFALPMQTLVGPFLKEGRNTIEIEVTNLAANRIRDLDMRGVDWKIMHEINIVNTNYQKFDSTKWPLQPSGLLGPVTLTKMVKSKT